MPHLPTAHFRRWSILLAVALPTALIAPATAQAGGAPGTVPIITSPTDLSTISSKTLTVTANSDATHVKFVVDGRSGDYTQLVEAVLGEASTQISLLGLSGSTLVEAYDCEVGGSCNVTGDSVAVTVDLTDPAIQSPEGKDVVGATVDVRSSAPGGSLQYFLDGSKVGAPIESPFDKRVSLSDKRDGEHTIKVRQCNTAGDICLGDTDTVTVIKDTKGPRFTDVGASLGTVFPVKDNYKDLVKLSARVGERSLETKVEIRKAGGPLVRTIKLGREDAGRLSTTWNGRKGNGDLVANGKYLFRFVGTDTHGVVGRSNDKAVNVSDKKLVKKTITKTVSALNSGVKDYSGKCSDVIGIRYLDGYGRSWPGGLQWRSNVRRTCSGDAEVALSAHVAGTEKAIRYGSLRISAYGGAALSRGGPAKLLYIKGNETVGARQTLGTGLGWHNGDRVSLKSYLIGSKLLWFVGTANGNWYDIKEFKISYTISVLR